MMENFIWVIFAHFIGDWGITTNYLMEAKKKKFLPLLAHSMIYTGVVSVAFKYLGLFNMNVVITLALSHGLVDTWKDNWAPGCSWYKDYFHDAFVYVDQIMHLGILGILVF
jgi:hypothetical protein